MDIAEVETIDELRTWITQFMPEATVEFSDGSVIIKTGMDIAMGGYLTPLSERI
jgi:hypothetical protein